VDRDRKSGLSDIVTCGTGFAYLFSVEICYCSLTPSLSRRIEGREGNITSPVGYGAGPQGTHSAYSSMVLYRERRVRYDVSTRVAFS
jgi:hypothetical protein